VPRTGEIDVRDFVKQARQKQSKIPILNANYLYKTPKEYAEFLGKHPITIFKWLTAGKIEGAIKVGRNWKIPVKGAE
jgi:hypothetical protein